VSLYACLPAELRGPRTTITKIAAGFSGAGIHRVDVDGRAYVLKVTAEEQPLADWGLRLCILRAAADAGLAPRVVHVDEPRRAIMSEFVADQSFPRLYRDPRTHGAALALLGETLRRVHAIPVPPEAAPSRPRELLGSMWSGLWSKATLPRFVIEVVERALAEPPPPAERTPVLSHNDANPTNLVFDGERILFLDWDVAAPNDPLYDLAVVSLFLRMNEETCRRLVASHDAAPPSSLSPTFLYFRRLTGVMLGVGFLSLARQGGHDGTGPETLDAVPPLADFYQKLQTGALSLGTGDGRWAFGLGLMKEAFALER
jgi:aminoglycoside phosphotransferase (APT) family kinase protein